jgi:hypothetical protein
MTQPMDEIARAYQNATGKWSTWAWASAFHCACGQDDVIARETVPPEALAGGGHQAFCAEAISRGMTALVESIERDAVRAEKHAARALDRARAGDYRSALDEARLAAAIEAKYGECPTWRPLVDAIEAVLDGVTCAPGTA